MSADHAPSARLLPEEDEHSELFWDACRRGSLEVQACSDCERLRFPPRPMCPWCRSLDHRWRAVSGRGSIWSYVVVHPPVLPAYADLAPYPVVVVELAEHPTLRMVGNVVTSPDGPINEVDPGDLRIGTSVRVVFAEEDEGVVLPRWVLEP